MKVAPRKPKPKLTEEDRAAIALRRQLQAEDIARRKLEMEAKEAAILASIIEDKPAGYNLVGERGLIAAVFVQALNDMLACPHPDFSRANNYRKDSAEARSIDAMRFVNKDNELFCLYCELLDYEPAYMEKSIFKFFKKQIELQRRPKKPVEVEQPCNANIVSILSHLLSELLVMIMATRFYVAESVRDAA